ncbi:hypothetical protein ACFL6U_23800 [Planctomycetota bacterium]
MYIGTTPGTVQIPAGHTPIFLPTGKIEKLFADYNHEFTSKGIRSIYLSDFAQIEMLNCLFSTQKQLTHIVLDNCGYNINPIHNLTLLKHLEIHNNVHVSDLSLLSDLPSIESLIISTSNNVFSRHIPSSTSLRYLLLHNIAKPVNLPKLISCIPENFPSLKVLHINNCGRSHDTINISSLYKINLDDFQAAGTPIVDPEGLYEQYCIERSEISAFLDTLTDLTTEASLHWQSAHINDLTSLCEKAPAIKHLKLANCSHIDSLSNLSQFEELVSLDLFYCNKIQSLEPLSECRQLKSLNINNCQGILDFKCLIKCKSLATLNVFHENGTTISPGECNSQITFVKNHREIEIYIDSIAPDTDSITLNWEYACEEDLTIISQKATNITSLAIARNRKLSDLSCISSFDNIKSLRLTECHALASLMPLLNLRNLTELSVVGCPNILDYRSLLSCTTLKCLEIRGEGGVLTPQVYHEQIADVFISIHKLDSFTFDVPEQVLIDTIEGLSKFVDCVRDELLCNSDCPCQDKRCTNDK